MGYYTGSGVTTGGGESTRQFGSLVYGGAHIVMQKTVSTVTKRSGVSLETAKAEKSSLSLATKTFSWANIYPWVGCCGTSKDVSYSQIEGSNLYELTINNKTMTASGDGGSTWVGPT